MHQEVDRYLDLLDARRLADAWTTSADVEATKPKPDLVHAALEQAGADTGLMVVGRNASPGASADDG
jgi:phosphoglycolate phosphatase-like HAD superfamily hydrolase